MAKFSPGDKVIVRSDLQFGSRMGMEDNPGNCDVDHDHERFAGKQVTIREIYSWNMGGCWCYRIKEDNVTFWMDDMFENPVAPISEDKLAELLSI